MWTVRCRLTLGDYKLPDWDVTPVCGLTAIALVVFLLIQTGM